MSARDDFAHHLIRAFYERWDRLESEKDAISGDLKELFAEAKGQGFDTKVLRKLFRDQKADAGERQEFEALYDLYAAALNGPLARDARDAREDDEEFDPETGEIKPAGNGASGAEEETQVATVRASSSANPSAMSNGVDGAPEGQGEAGAGTAGETPPTGTLTASPPVSEIAEPGDRSADGPAAAPVVADNIVPIKKRWTFNDPAHRDCLDPTMCGGFSNLKLCQRCREASEGGQVA